MFLKLLLLNFLALFQNNNVNEPVRLEKKQENTQSCFNLTTQEIEIIVIGLFLTILFLCAFIFITSCTDSGVIYNHSLA